MKTAEETLIETVAKVLGTTVQDSKKQFDEAIKEDPQLIAFIEAMNIYATEAIKADRERTTHAATEKYKETGMTNTAANVKEIILNLPIELP